MPIKYSPENRAKTAIRRTNYSLPVQLVIADGLLTPESTFLDYGCGKGDDVRRLLREGKVRSAFGWDPYYPTPSSRENEPQLCETEMLRRARVYLANQGFNPDDGRPFAEPNVVNLGYVLNVIENRQEREEALKSAFLLARDLLVVTVRPAAPHPRGWRKYRDGHVTPLGTFQRFWAPPAFRRLVHRVTGEKPIMRKSYVAYIFKNEKLAVSFLVKRLGRRGRRTT